MDKHRHCPGCGYPTDHTDNDPFCSSCAESGTRASTLFVHGYTLGRLEALLRRAEAVSAYFAPGYCPELDDLRAMTQATRADLNQWAGLIGPSKGKPER